MFKRIIEPTLLTLGLSLTLASGCDDPAPAQPPDTDGTTGDTDSDTSTDTDPTNPGTTTDSTLDSSGEVGNPCDGCAENAMCIDDACVCNEGYEGDGTVCDDADECADGTNDCDANATCTNTEGSFECACNDGFVGDGTACEAAESCADDPCDANATCTDEDEGYSCACNDGWEGDGFSCDDEDECAGDPCDTNATCTNTDGSFECACNPGWDGDGMTCNDLDECTGMPCDPNATCTNNEGGFDCTCNMDFAGDGFTCMGTLGYGETCMDADPCASGLCILAPYDQCSEYCNQAIPDDCPNVGAAGFCVPVGMNQFACVGNLDTGIDGDAEILSPGDSAIRSVNTLTDADLFHLNLPVGDFGIDVQPDFDDDIQLEFHDQIGQPIGVINNGGDGVIEGANLGSSGGVYFVVVRNVGNSTGGYQIVVNPI